MKSSVFNSFSLPWSTQKSGANSEKRQRPVLMRSNCEFDKMDNMNHHSPCMRTRKMPPLLRLNSEGEITTGNHFCDRAMTMSKQISNHLHLSNSFDSSSYSSQSQMPSNGYSSNKNNFYHPPLIKSLSEPNHPVHQSFPPPASTLSAIRHFRPTCPMTDNLSSYSAKPCILRSVDVFGANGQSDSSCDLQYTCAIISSFSNNNNNSDNSCNKYFKNMDPKKDKMDQVDSKCVDSSYLGEQSNYVLNIGDDKEAESSEGGKTNACYHSSAPVDDKEASKVLHARKKKRKRCSRGKRKKQKSTPFNPSSCSSPVKGSRDNKYTDQQIYIHDSSTGYQSASHTIMKNDKSQSLIGETTALSSNVISPCLTGIRMLPFTESDSDKSVGEDQSDDDLVFEDSVCFENSPMSDSNTPVMKKHCKILQNRGLSKNSSLENKLFHISDESDNEQNNSLHTSLQLTLSLTVSEDEENDSSVEWDTSASPSGSDQFIFEFEFNTGLSLEAIIGQNPSKDCPSNKKLQNINAKWNKLYNTSRHSCDIVKSERKVCFAKDGELETVHLVGDEDRGGEWQLFALERARFQRKIDDVGLVISPVLSKIHRAKVLERMNI